MLSLCGAGAGAVTATAAAAAAAAVCCALCRRCYRRRRCCCSVLRLLPPLLRRCCDCGAALQGLHSGGAQAGRTAVVCAERALLRAFRRVAEAGRERTADAWSQPGALSVCCTPLPLRLVLQPQGGDRDSRGGASRLAVHWPAAIWLMLQAPGQSFQRKYLQVATPFWLHRPPGRLLF